MEHAWPAPPPHPGAAGPPGSGRFRALSLGELLDSIFSLYRRNFLLIASISAVVQVPYALVTTLLLAATGSSVFSSGGVSGVTVNPTTGQAEISPQQLQQALGFLGVEVGLALLSLLVVLPLAVAATTRAVSDRYLDAPTSLGTAYRAAGRRFWSLVAQSCILAGIVIGLTVLLGAVVFAGALLGRAGIIVIIAAVVVYAVGVIFIYVRTSLAAPAIVLEHLSGWAGLVRSWNLVRGQSWRIFGIRLLVGVITSVISGIVVGLLSAAGIGLDVNGRFILDEVASAIAAVFINPITYITVTLLYYDTRIRREGFDIEMLARSL